MAKVGDVLGTVTVRSYLDRKEAAWWQEGLRHHSPGGAALQCFLDRAGRVM
jgi:hypothetical protein